MSRRSEVYYAENASTEIGREAVLINLPLYTAPGVRCGSAGVLTGNDQRQGAWGVSTVWVQSLSMVTRNDSGDGYGGTSLNPSMRWVRGYFSDGGSVAGLASDGFLQATVGLEEYETYYDNMCIFDPSTTKETGTGSTLPAAATRYLSSHPGVEFDRWVLMQ